MTELFVSGYAQLGAPAEWVRIRVSIAKEGPTGPEALDNATPVCNAVDRIIAEYGAAITKSASTSLGVHLNPARDGHADSWVATKAHFIETNALSRIPGLVMAVTDAGGAANASEWGIDPRSPLHAEARLLAVADAQARAADYAKALGKVVGDILWLSEPGVRGVNMANQAISTFAFRSRSQPEVSFDPANVTVRAEVVMAFTLA